MNSEHASESYAFGEIVFDVAAHQLTVKGETVDLTPTEFAMLHHLVRHPKQVISRSQLLEAADLGVFEGVERTVDVHIHNLRNKIESDPSKPVYLKTAFGAGYRFVTEET